MTGSMINISIEFTSQFIDSHGVTTLLPLHIVVHSTPSTKVNKRSDWLRANTPSITPTEWNVQHLRILHNELSLLYNIEAKPKTTWNTTHNRIKIEAGFVNAVGLNIKLYDTVHTSMSNTRLRSQVNTLGVICHPKPNTEYISHNCKLNASFY